MFVHSARLLVVCTLTVIGTACAEGAGPARGNAQPGEACTATHQCAVGFSCIDEECRQTDPYRISLTWDVDTDFDLHVRAPDGRELYFGRDNAYAWLGADDCASEDCEDEDKAHAEHAFLHVELPDDVDASAFFPDERDGGDSNADTDGGVDIPPNTPAFSFAYWVDNYGCQKAGDFTLSVIAANDTVIERRTGTLEARCMESEHFVTPLLPFPQD